MVMGEGVLTPRTTPLAKRLYSCMENIKINLDNVLHIFIKDVQAVGNYNIILLIILVLLS